LRVITAFGSSTAEGIFGKQTAIATEQAHHRPGALSRSLLPVLIPQAK